jgi:hypothetical protein
MTSPDFAELKAKAHEVIDKVEKESVAAYLFLSREFAKGPINDNWLFQFVYRSFYRLDNAGLTPEFKSAYFQCMEDARRSRVEIAAIVKKLHTLPNRKKQQTLQFSFATKLANTIDCCKYPIYDGEVARYFGFRAPYPTKTKPFEARLGEFLAFYEWLGKLYEHVVAQESLNEMLDRFYIAYGPESRQIPPPRVLDFIFWAAGKSTLRPCCSYRCESVLIRG